MIRPVAKRDRRFVKHTEAHYTAPDTGHHASPVFGAYEHMKRGILSTVTIAGTGASAAVARGFVVGARKGDPEYDLLLGALSAAAAAIAARYNLTVQ